MITVRFGDRAEGLGDAVVETQGFIAQDAGDNFGRPRGVGGQLLEADGAGAEEVRQVVARESVDDTRNAAVEYGGAAHEAGLVGGVKGAVAEVAAAEDAGGEADGFGLGVGGDVDVDELTVGGGDDDLAVPDDDGG
jgi:hypothetical protein